MTTLEDFHRLVKGNHVSTIIKLIDDDDDGSYRFRFNYYNDEIF
jgi:hypothetical protein